MHKTFLLPAVVSFAILAIVYAVGGLSAFLLAALLSVLEVTLSFDNAVVNAKVLKRMSEKWQKRFLTWGILVAVFGTRFVLPILIVSVATWASPYAIASLAFFNPAAYGALLEHSHHAISAFGGAFLLMVSLKYFFDTGKEVHWIRFVERRLARWGSIEAIEIAIALLSLLALSALSHGEGLVVLSAGIVGIVLFVCMEGITGTLDSSFGTLASQGFALFIYLNILDTAFSLDGVIGAFALTSNLLIIAAGLGIGAYFVRTLTVFMVREKTLESLKYLEHGAHWAIMGLAGAMLISLVMTVPEIITGGVGLVFIALSFISSRREAR